MEFVPCKEANSSLHEHQTQTQSQPRETACRKRKPPPTPGLVAQVVSQSLPPHSGVSSELQTPGTWIGLS